MNREAATGELAHRAGRTIAFDLIGLEVTHADRGRIALAPGKGHIRQGWGFLLFMVGIALAIALAAFLMLYAGERSADAPPTAWAAAATVAGLPIVYGLAALVRTYRQRFAMSLATNKVLTFSGRGWGARTHRESLAALAALRVAAVPVRIESTPVRGDRIRTIGQFWVWYIALEFQGQTGATELRLRVKAEERAEHAPNTPPAQVVQIACWLQAHSGREPELVVAP